MHDEAPTAPFAVGARKAPLAFTLVEMLVVMGVIALLISITTPAMNSLRGAGDVSKAVYDIAGTLEQARAYAMSSSTYVYVGIQESDANTPDTAARLGDGVGRVSVAVVASRDGTRGYDPNSPTTWKTNYASGKSLFIVGKVQRFSNLHLVDLGEPPTTPGSMQRPALVNADGSADTASNLANTMSTSLTPFEYPTGKDFGSGQYTFNKVIQFDPQGVARIQLVSNGDAIVQRMEIGLQQTHGNSAPGLASPAVTGSIAAIQLDAMTGSAHIYRP